MEQFLIFTILTILALCIGVAAIIVGCVSLTKKSPELSVVQGKDVTTTAPLKYNSNEGRFSISTGANLEVDDDGKLAVSSTPIFSNYKLGNTGTISGVARGFSPAQSASGTYTIPFGCIFPRAPHVVATSDYPGLAHNVSIFVTSVTQISFNITILNGPNSHFENFSGVYWIAMI